MLAILALPVAAQAAPPALTWAAPTALDTVVGSALPSVSCPSASECVAGEAFGQVVVFNPGANATPTPVAVDSGFSLNALTCISTTQCTAVDSHGQQVTFDPTKLASGPAPKVFTIDGTHSLSSVSCPTAFVCVAGDDSGSIVTFPAAGGTAYKISPVFPVISGSVRPITALACASLTACVAFDGNGEEVTYNAQTFQVTAHADPTDYPSDPAALDSGNTVGSVTCLPNGNCVAVDTIPANSATMTPQTGQAFTFSPASPGATTPSGVGLATASASSAGFGSNSLSCSSNTQCDAIDVSGNVWQFDPTTSLPPTLGNPVLPPAESPVASPSAELASGHVFALSCSSTSACVATDTGGNEVTFNPNAPASQARVGLIFGETLTSIACPAENECIAADAFGDAIMNDFTNPTGTGTFAVIDPLAINAIACSSTTQCTGVSPNGFEDTYNPMSSTQVQVGLVDTGNNPTGVACTSANQCVLVDGSGNEVTFDPHAPQGAKAVVIDVAGSPAAGVKLTAIACPSATQCTAVDANGAEVTFNPASPGHPTPTLIDSASTAATPVSLNAIACPSASQCTAVDQMGNQVTFNPTAPAKSSTQIDGTNVLTGIACISGTDCVAVDANGNALQGDPTSAGAWTSTPLAGATGPTAVTCASADLCIAVDSVGNAFPAGFAPVNTAAPAVSGKAVVGDTLSVTNGTWTGTSGITYTYQWQDCTGGNCTAISGATSQTYTLASSDTGFTVNCMITATNEIAPNGVIATSNSSKPVAPALATIKASLAKALAFHGSRRSVLKHRGFSTRWTAPSAGRLVIQWFHGKVLVAKSSVNVSKAGKVKVSIRLTKRGRKLLASATRVKLKAKGTFTPTQSTPVSLTKTITLR